MKKLAVIISVYKNDKLSNLSKAIESILNQTYSNFNVYIKFDGKIASECEDYIDNLHDNRVVVFKRDENRGLATSLNELLNVALGKKHEFIARMDADDICHEQRFEKQVDFLLKNKTIDCLGTWAIEINENEEEYFKKEMPSSHEDCLSFFKKRDCLIHPTVMFRNTYFTKAGLYPEDTYFGEDTMMWAKGFANNCKFANLQEYLLYFRLDENFFDRRRGVKHAKSILMLRLKVNEMLGFGLRETIYAYMYAGVKMLPTPLLNVAYKIFR